MKTHLDKEIADLIEGGESYRCERKSDLSSGDGKEKICKAICAFANDLAGSGEIGVVAIGVNDDGSPSGLTISDALEQEIQSIRGEGKIVPLPSFVVRKRGYRGSEILCVEVQPASAPPVKYNQRIWIRSGNTSRLASAEDERILNEKRRSKDQPDDLQSLQHFRLADLNLEYFRSNYLTQAYAQDVLEANGRSIEEQLSSTKMIAAVSDPHPTILGMLCIGLSPTDAVPGAYVQFLRIAGETLNDAIADEAVIQGNIADVIQQTEAKFVAHNSIAIDFTSKDREQRSPQYPRVAFEQLFRNAVMHRLYVGTNTPIRVYWFSNRIEITSPGGPYGVVTVENFGRPGFADYRNPNLAASLRDLGFVQRFGAGISKARSAMIENGNPPLELYAEASIVTTIMRAPA